MMAAMDFFTTAIFRGRYGFFTRKVGIACPNSWLGGTAAPDERAGDCIMGVDTPAYEILAARYA